MFPRKDFDDKVLIIGIYSQIWGPVRFQDPKLPYIDCCLLFSLSYSPIDLTFVRYSLLLK